MFVFKSYLTVPPDDREAIERLFSKRPGLVDGFPGFRYLQLLKPRRGEATHVFLTAWDDEEAFRRYMRSEEHEATHTPEALAIMSRSSVRHEAYHVLMDSREPRE